MKCRKIILIMTDSQRHDFVNCYRKTGLQTPNLDRIAENEEAHKALNTIRLITMVQTGSKFNYNRIRELNPLMDTVRTAHDKMLE